MHSGVTHERCANFQQGKKQKRGEFITPPRPTRRRSNYGRCNSDRNDNLSFETAGIAKL